MRGTSASCTSTPKSRNEMHLAVRAHRLHDAQDGYLTIDSHRDVGFEVSILHQGVLHPGIKGLQLSDNSAAQWWLQA